MTNESAIHIKNLKFLLTEINNPSALASKHKSTIKYGIDTIVFKDSQIWQNIPLEKRNSASFSLFKLNITQIHSLSCRCKICRSFIANLGYID